MKETNLMLNIYFLFQEEIWVLDVQEP